MAEVDEINENGCSPENPLPTYVSTGISVLSITVGLGVCIAGSYEAYKKAKEKALAKMLTKEQGQQGQQGQQEQKESSQANKQTESKAEKLETKTEEKELGCSVVANMNTHSQPKMKNCISPNDTPSTMTATSPNQTVIKMEPDDNDDTNYVNFSNEVCSKSFLWKFLKYIPKEIFWNKRRCYFPFATHLIDQATDIGVIIKFYQISEYENSDNGINCPNINATYLFYLSLTAFMFYRIVSCIWICIITKCNIFHAISQIFDLKLYHALYINFKLNKQQPNSAQRYLQLLEATLESFPQCVIQLYYLIQVGFDNENQTIVVLSSIFSIYNIVSKMVSEETDYFEKDYQSLELECECEYWYMNWRYIARAFIRLCDFLCRLFLILLTWLVLGGEVVVIYLGFELFALVVIAVITGELSCLIWIAQTPLKTPHIGCPCKRWSFCSSISDNDDWVSYLTCSGFCNDDANFGHWCFVMYRTLVSVGFFVAISIDVHSVIGLMFFNLILLLALNYVNVNWVDHGKSATMERNGDNLVQTGAFGEIQDLTLFGAKIKVSRDLVDGAANRHNNFEVNPVVAAAKKGDVEILECCLKQGLQVDIYALIGASQYHQVNCIDFLLTNANKDKYKQLADLNVNQHGLDGYKQITPLMAAMRGRFSEETLRDTLQILIEKYDADVNAQNKKGLTALVVGLISEGEESVAAKKIELLLAVSKGKVNINIQDKKRKTCVMYAAERRWIRVMKMLVDEGADLKCTDKDGCTVMDIAIREFNANVVEFLMEDENIFDINKKDLNGETALMATMKIYDEFDKGDEIDKGNEMLTVLLNKNADVNATNNNGDTALMIGVAHGNIEQLRSLIFRAGGKIDFNVRNKRGDNAVMKVICIADDSTSVSVLNLLRSNNVNINVAEGNALLLRAMIRNNKIMIEYLLREKLVHVDDDGIDYDDKYTCNELLIGNKEMNIDVLHILLSKGCHTLDYRSKDRFGDDDNGTSLTITMETILNSYDEERSVKVLKIFRQYEADFNVRDRNGNTLLLYAASKANSMAMEYLLDEKMADVNEVNDNGDTALMKIMDINNALEFEKVKKSLDVLLKHFNADANVTNNCGQTALMKGVTNGNFDEIKYFVSICGDSIDYDTALNIARREQLVDIVKLLEE